MLSQMPPSQTPRKKQPRKWQRLRFARRSASTKRRASEPSIIIEVTRLFTSDVFELSAKQRLNATMMDPSRSYIERISPYPENIEVEATPTYTRMPAPPACQVLSSPILSWRAACVRAAPPWCCTTAW